jgi:hypothetical protein
MAKSPIDEVQAALDSRWPVKGQHYVPWWAQGEYAAKHGHSYTTESGVVVKLGKIVGSKRPEDPPKKIESVKLAALCTLYGLPASLYEDAPNVGVATMRVKNAIAKL